MSIDSDLSGDTILRQAWMTAEEYLRHAIDSIDAFMGPGYASKHPELIAAYMQTAAIDCATAVFGSHITLLAETLNYTFQKPD